VRFVGGDADQRAHGGLNAVTSDPEFHTFFKAPTVILLLVDKRAIGGAELELRIAHPFEIATALVLGYPKGQIDGIVEREETRIEWLR
jgi:hypothetical protein